MNRLSAEALQPLCRQLPLPMFQLLGKPARLALVMIIAAGCVPRQSRRAGATVKQTQAIAIAPQLPEVSDPPLSDDGYHCAMAIEALPPFAAGTVAHVRVKLTKLTQEHWAVMTNDRSPNHTVNLSYHWLKLHSKEVVKEGGRVFLPASINTGESVTLVMPVESPVEAEGYLLVVEPVQEGVSWFSAKGGCSKTIIAEVIK